MRLSIVCDESKSSPISGIATFATDRLRFATVATAISDARTSPARAGPLDSSPRAPAVATCARSYGVRRTRERNRVLSSTAVQKREETNGRDRPCRLHDRRVPGQSVHRRDRPGTWQARGQRNHSDHRHRLRR